MAEIFRNYMRVKGEDATLFLEVCKGHRANYWLRNERLDEGDAVDFTLNAIVPVPEIVLDLGFKDGGYFWQDMYWGSRYDTELSRQPIITENSLDKQIVEIYFNSYGNPPYPWLEEASKQYPSWKFEIFSIEDNGLAMGKPLHKRSYFQGEIEDDCSYFPNDWAYMAFMIDIFQIENAVETSSCLEL